MDTTNENPVRHAVDLLGGVAPTSARFGISLNAVYKWVRRGEVPAARCRDLEKALRRRVTRYALNPRVFGPDPKGPRNG